MNWNLQFLIFKFTSSLVAHVQEATMLHQVSFYQEMTRLAKKTGKIEKWSSTHELLKYFRTISGSLRAALQKHVLDWFEWFKCL